MNKLASYGQVAAVMALLVIFVGANAVATVGGNGTTIGDGLLSDEEFLMESETARRILAGTKPGFSYPALGKDARNCNAGNSPSASCDSNQNKIHSPGRRCSFNDLCRRK